MNKLIIIGNLTHSPDTRTVNDKTVCNFTVAVNSKRSGAEDATFFRVAAWNKTGENCQKYLVKGSRVAVEGSVSTRAYMSKENEPKASLEVFAQNVEFLGAKQASNEPAQASPGGFTEVSEEELPF